MSKPKKKLFIIRKKKAPENPQEEDKTSRLSGGSVDDIDCLCMKHLNTKIFKCKAFLNFKRKKKSKNNKLFF